MLNNPNATEQQIQDEITKVNAAKEKLGKAEAGLTTAATAQAKQELTTAKEGLEEPVSTDGMTPDSIKAYEAAKKEAAQAVADAKAAAQAAEAKGENRDRSRSK
ncbi:surface anchored protein [Streptococcus pneumoniae]|nr:surface anchored protein [Streptococcus pneumoniae]